MERNLLRLRIENLNIHGKVESIFYWHWGFAESNCERGDDSSEREERRCMLLTSEGIGSHAKESQAINAQDMEDMAILRIGNAIVA